MSDLIVSGGRKGKVLEGRTVVVVMKPIDLVGIP
jgi:hypothetical protein